MPSQLRDEELGDDELQDVLESLIAFIIKTRADRDDKLFQAISMLAKSRDEKEPTSIPRFIGPAKDVQAVLSHIHFLSKAFRSSGLTTVSDDADIKEHRRRTAVRLANNSIEEETMKIWVGDFGRRMERDGETTWEEWSAAFKKEALPSTWEIDERRKLGRLTMEKTSDWMMFDSLSRSIRRNLRGTSRYPNDKEMVRHYEVGLPEALYRQIRRNPAFLEGSLNGIRTLIKESVKAIEE
nr:hypothetical protein L203_01907 [Cryptococcus depauperatus CBS 7841]